MGKGNRTRARREPRTVQIAPGSSLGSFGDDIDPVDYHFEWCKEATIRVHPEASILAELDFVEEAMGYDEDDPRNITVLKEQMRKLVEPDDFDLFWEIAVRRRQGVPQLQRLQQAIFGQLAVRETDRPTSRPGDSTPGPQSTEPKSGSEPQPSPDPVMERYKGRPDLQLAVWRADQEAAAEKAG